MGTMHSSMSALVKDQPPAPDGAEKFMSRLLIRTRGSGALRRLATSSAGHGARWQVVA
jgi:hypothetical protein